MRFLRRGIFLSASLVVLAVAYGVLSQPDDGFRYSQGISRGDTNTERSLAADSLKSAEPFHGQHSQLKKPDSVGHYRERLYDDYSSRLETAGGEETEPTIIGEWRDPMGIDTPQSVSIEVGEFQDPLTSIVPVGAPLTVGKFRDPLQ